MSRFTLIDVSRNYKFLVLVLFLILVFVTGGGARADIESLAILRPAAVLFLALGLWWLRYKHLKENWFLFLLFFAMIVLLASHLVPLPPALWTQMPGRTLIAQVDEIAGLGDVWRPISMAPQGTWNALYSLLIPAACLVLAVQIDRRQKFLLLLLFLVLGVFSGLLGLLQTIGSSEGPLYFYRISNFGSAVGLFSNRNHHAVFLACLFPMLAVYASVNLRSTDRMRYRAVVAAGIGFFIIPLLLVTGSRAGILLGLLGVSSTYFLYTQPTNIAPSKRTVQRFNPLFVVAGVVAVAGVALLTLIMSRAKSIDRLLSQGWQDDARVQVWSPIFDLSAQYFSIGSGLGSFVEVYQIHESIEQLHPRYLNHAHNDWLELLMTGGLPAMLLLFIFLLWWAKRSWNVFGHAEEGSKSQVFARLGVVVSTILGLASIVDYPLRTPSLSCLFVVMLVWLAANPRSSEKNASTFKNAGLTRPTILSKV